MSALGHSSIAQNLLLPHSDHIIQRDQAQAALHHAINHHALVFLHAPSGYGKTTLIREYVDRKNCQFQYLCFSQTVSPAEFWPSFFLGIKRIDYGLGEKLERLLSDLTSDTFIQSVIQKLSKASGGIHHTDKLLIIFDNTHLFDQALLLQIDAMIDDLPHWLRLIMCAQQPLDLKLVSRQAKGQCQIFNQDLLKLDTQQSWLLFQQNQQDDYNNTDEEPLKTKLMKISGGWPAVINILTRDQYQLQQAFNLSFASNLYPFIQESIFNNIHKASEAFLYSICMLNAFSPTVLMTLLLEDKNIEHSPQSIQSHLISGLESGLIEKSNDSNAPYIVPEVIKQFLQTNFLLSPANKTLFTDQKIKARDTFIHEENYNQALILSLELQHWPQASNLLLKMSQEFLQTGDVQQLKYLLDYFPTDFIYSQPFLCLLKSLIFISAYEQQQAKLFMDAVDQHLNALETKLMGQDEKSKHTILLSMGLENDAEIDILINAHHILYGLMQRFTMEYKPSDQKEDASLKNNLLSSNHFLCWQHYGCAVDGFIQDDINNSIKQGNYALSLAKDIDDYSCIIASSGWLLHAMYYQGHVDQALELAHSTLQYLNDKNALTLANIHNLYAALCFLHIEKNQLDQAWHYFDLIQSSIGPFTEPREVLYSRYYLQLSLLNACQMHDEIEGALLELSQYQNTLTEKASQAGIEDFSILFNTDLTSALFELKNKNAFPLMQWAMSEFDENDINTTPSLFRFYYESFLHIVGKSFAGMDLSEELEHILEHNKKQGVLARSINIYMFKARQLFNQGELDACLEQLKILLPIAKQAGYVSLLIDDRHTQGILEFAQQKNIEQHYCAQLLSALQMREHNRAPHLQIESEPEDVFIPAQELFSTLTPREKEVLSQLSQGARNKELAQNLNLSVATVKRHLQNIYAKLQVSSRTEAILLTQPLLAPHS